MELLCRAERNTTFLEVDLSIVFRLSRITMSRRTNNFLMNKKYSQYLDDYCNIWNSYPEKIEEFVNALFLSAEEENQMEELFMVVMMIVNFHLKEPNAFKKVDKYSNILFEKILRLLSRENLIKLWTNLLNCEQYSCHNLTTCTNLLLHANRALSNLFSHSDAVVFSNDHYIHTVMSSLLISLSNSFCETRTNKNLSFILNNLKNDALDYVLNTTCRVDESFVPYSVIHNLTLNLTPDIALKWYTELLKRFSSAEKCGAYRHPGRKTQDSITSPLCVAKGVNNYCSSTADLGGRTPRLDILPNLIRIILQSYSFSLIIDITFVQRAYSSRVSQFILSCSSLFKDAKSYYECAYRTANLWGDPLFIASGKAEFHEYLSYNLLSILPLLSRDDLLLAPTPLTPKPPSKDKGSGGRNEPRGRTSPSATEQDCQPPLLVIISKGVSVHLDAQDPGVRRRGMRVAQCLARAMGANELNFDELRQEDDGQQAVSLGAGRGALGPAAADGAEEEIDPGAPGVPLGAGRALAGEGGADSDVDSDVSELEAYEDREPAGGKGEEEVHRCSYLRECLECEGTWDGVRRGGQPFELNS